MARRLRGKLNQNRRRKLSIVTIYSTLIAHGYFPKELPPSFFTEVFAKYATTMNGPKTLEGYKPADNFTECVGYRLALPGPNRRVRT